MNRSNEETNLEDGEHGLNLVFEHVEAGAEFAFDLVQIAFADGRLLTLTLMLRQFVLLLLLLLLFLMVVDVSRTVGGSVRRVAADGPAPDGSHALAGIEGVVLAVAVDGQEPSQQFLAAYPLEFSSSSTDGGEDKKNSNGASSSIGNNNKNT